MHLNNIGNVYIECDTNIDHIPISTTDEIHLICTVICNSNYEPVEKFVFNLNDFDSEKDMIKAWIKMILNNKLELLVGWYLEFDYEYIKERSKVLDIDITSEIQLPTLSIIKYIEQFGYYNNFNGAVRQILKKTLPCPDKNNIEEYALTCCKYEFLILKTLNN